MTPIPWPPIFRRRKPPTPARRRELLAELTADAIDAGTYGQPTPAVRYPPQQPQPTPTPPRSIQPPPDARTEHTAQRAIRPWLRREEDIVLPRLAQLTEQYGPWEAARRMFADDTEETP